MAVPKSEPSSARLASAAPDLSDQLWRSWIRQLDTIASGMGAEAGWEAGLDVLSETAPLAGAAKVATVTSKARRFEDGPDGRSDRRHARAALRIAARMDHAATR